MIPYMVGKLAPNPTYSTRGPVKYVSGRGYFRAVFSQNGVKYVSGRGFFRAVFSQNGDKFVTPLPLNR